MLPSDLTLSALRFILSAKSRQSCKQDCEAVDFATVSHIKTRGLCRILTRAAQPSTLSKKTAQS
ncbi:hypothetical protein PORUE0001_0880 [Porphyromonas uenonis 60-3]|uniref:Uncharacterized protein n=1 Tax=Porphyromonas uenonis 60-3 TaxID=596327 RepID=C2MCA2_9PORP|nr:hypothetical protein PORUE0001_0880 [Porphyromonas uenonis 60-3]